MSRCSAMEYQDFEARFWLFPTEPGHTAIENIRSVRHTQVSLHERERASEGNEQCDTAQPAQSLC